MKPIYRIIGRRGNTTIPYPLRMRLGIGSNNLISYALDGDRIIVRKEKICNGCIDDPNQMNDYMDTKELKELLSSLPFEARREAFLFLTDNLTRTVGGGRHR